MSRSHSSTFASFTHAFTLMRLKALCIDEGMLGMRKGFHRLVPSFYFNVLFSVMVDLYEIWFGSFNCI